MGGGRWRGCNYGVYAAAWTVCRRSLKLDVITPDMPIFTIELVYHRHFNYQSVLGLSNIDLRKITPTLHNCGYSVFFCNLFMNTIKLK